VTTAGFFPSRQTTESITRVDDFWKSEASGVHGAVCFTAPVRPSRIATSDALPCCRKVTTSAFPSPSMSHTLNGTLFELPQQ